MKMIEKKDEKHEKKFPVYQIPQAERAQPQPEVGNVVNDQSEIFFDHRTHRDDQKIVAAGVNNIANEGCELVAEPTYTPPPIQNSDVAKEFRCKYPIKLHKTKTLLSMEQRCALTGEEHISLIEDQYMPFNIQDILRDYGHCWKIFYSSLGVFYPDTQETSPSIQAIIYREIKKTMWLLHDDPLRYLNEVLDIENSIHAAARQERIFKKNPNYPLSADMRL